ncbi:CASP-like protein 5A2 isoform X2 [Triticum aestivum]|nr:CASP-like protein 5A2 isoform X2 [Triticum aestivum]
MEANFWDWLHHGGAMLPRPSHPLVHPDPEVAAAAAAAEQGQAPAAGAQGPAPAAAVAQGQPAAAAAQGQAIVAAQGQGQGVVAAQGQGQGPAPAAAAQGGNANGDAPPPGVLMVDLLGAPGTRWGLGTRLAQAVFAAAAVASMASTDDFRVVTAFSLLIAAASLQCLWSLALGAVDIYALLVKRAFRSPRATTMYSIGDWVQVRRRSLQQVDRQASPFSSTTT